jgi:hypothetical protein
MVIIEDEHPIERTYLAVQRLAIGNRACVQLGDGPVRHVKEEGGLARDVKRKQRHGDVKDAYRDPLEEFPRMPLQLGFDTSYRVCVSDECSA